MWKYIGLQDFSPHPSLPTKLKGSYDYFKKKIFIYICIHRHTPMFSSFEKDEDDIAEYFIM